MWYYMYNLWQKEKGNISSALEKVCLIKVGGYWRIIRKGKKNLGQYST